MMIPANFQEFGRAVRMLGLRNTHCLGYWTVRHLPNFIDQSRAPLRAQAQVFDFIESQIPNSLLSTCVITERNVFYVRHSLIKINQNQQFMLPIECQAFNF